MKKNKKKQDIPNVCRIEDGVIITQRSFNTGKLIDLMVPNKVQAGQHSTWYENYQTFRRIKQVIAENMKAAKTPEEHDAYRQQMQQHEQTFRPAPTVSKWTKIRARVIGPHEEGGSVVEPAYPKDYKIVTQMGH